ncbi:BNR repeat domain protein [Sorangium cellulosum So ce56]|uniref:BNR repeat domain protein n=2 Tax=Sorangium cellulosum TaxID=56 RepID=A9FNY4_SORC5|nr:BNR repeat domain protein [Sorangium cellulosum So ce56]
MPIKEMQMRRWMGICPLLACAALSACTGADEAGDENEKSEELGQVSEAVETANMLSSNVLSTNTLTDNALTMNALTMNALTDNALTMNALTMDTLNALNDGAIASDTVSTRRGHLSRELLRYIYKCAMPEDNKMMLTLDALEHPGQTEQVEFEGEIGLAPEWETGECDEECKQWVSACVLARVNGYHVKVDISLRGAHWRLWASPQEQAEYKNFEGRFWGNIFAGSTQQDHRACRGPGANLGHITGRICASNGGNCSFQVYEDCTQACWGEICEGKRSVEVWLKDPPASDCGNGICQTGEDSSSCSMDCPASVAITDHETSGHYVKTVAAVALDADTVVYAGFTNAPTIAGLDALDPPPVSSKDIFVVKAKADGTYLLATRWAAADGDEITDVDANAAMGYVAVAINSKIRVLDPDTLDSRYADITTDLAKVQSISSADHSGEHWLEVVGMNSQNQPEWREYTVSGGAHGRSRPVDTTTGTWTQRVLDSCNALAARSLSSGAIMVRKSSSWGEDESFCGNGSAWSVTIDVPEIADPIPVAALPAGIVAGTNGKKTQSFIGRVVSGHSSWAWINRLSSPDPTREVKVTSAEVQGQVVVVAGEFRGPIDFAGTIPSPLPDRRLGVNANRDAFVAAYDLTTGALRWVRSYGGPGDNDALDAFTFDHSGRLWAFGTFEGTPTLDGTVAPGTDGDKGTDSMRLIVGPLPLNEQQTLAVAPWGMVATQTDGTLWAWGDNSQGTLGPEASTTAPGSLPVEIPITRAVFGTAAGGAHALALDGAGVVWSWGDNSYGQLGDGTTADRATHPQALGLQGIVAIAAGKRHSLALRGDGRVLAWGDDSAAQLSNGAARTPNGFKPRKNTVFEWPTAPPWPPARRSTGTLPCTPARKSGDLLSLQPVRCSNSTLSPALVPMLDRITAIVTGEEHSLALRQDGTVWAWGNNGNGQLGVGTAKASQVPVKIPTLNGVTAIAAGANHSLAVRGDGTVWAWGNNAHGQLGDGTTSQRSEPVQVSELGQVLRVAGGTGHSLALKADGTVWAFGSNSHGQLGVSTSTSQRSIAAPVSGISHASAVACGGNSSAVLLPTGDIRTWGENSKGQLGDGVLGQARFLPTGVRGAFDSQTVAMSLHTLVARKDGTIDAWGRDHYGEAGDFLGSGARTEPKRIPGISRVRSVAVGDRWSMALRKDGSVWTWGISSWGVLGDGKGCDSDFAYPGPLNQVAALSDIIQISASLYNGYALKKDGTVWGWGFNSYYQELGDRPGCEPAPIPGLSDIVAIDAGDRFGLALKKDGTLWGWGLGGRGYVDPLYFRSPAQFENLKNVVRFGAGTDSSAAVTADGKIWTWGANYYGQLGIAGASYYTEPVDIHDQSGFIDVSVGDWHVLGIKADGTVWGWGHNGGGQLGDGTTQTRSTPVLLLSSIAAAKVYAMGVNSLIMQTNRSLLGSGDNHAGQLGRRMNMDGSTPQRLLDIQ